jgi:hypothetical protein
MDPAQGCDPSVGKLKSCLIRLMPRSGFGKRAKPDGRSAAEWIRAHKIMYQRAPDVVKQSAHRAADCVLFVSSKRGYPPSWASVEF